MIYGEKGVRTFLITLNPVLPDVSFLYPWKTPGSNGLKQCLQKWHF